MSTATCVVGLLASTLTLVGCGPGSGGGGMGGPAIPLGNLIGPTAPATPVMSPPETVLGCDLVEANGIVRWRECKDAATCGHVEHTRPSGDVIAVVHLAPTSLDGPQRDLVKLSLRGRPRR